jgi:dTDP-4-amino-4,6-dideoxygalactose transaminase
MIRMNDFCADPEPLLRKQEEAFARVMRSGWYILGPELEAFEREWASYCGTSACLGVANGMDAIEIGLRAAGVGPGDEIITTPMTAFATVLGILRTGAQPVLADIDPGTALLSRESVERCLSPKTKGVLFVHLYGQVDDMGLWLDFCAAHNIELYEDCAQAHGSRWQGRVAGSFGRFGAYSFYPTKNLGALGDAGALVTQDPELAARARKLRNYGQSERYHHPILGLNSRLDELQAALLRERLQWLDVFTERRRAIARVYGEILANHPTIQTLSAPAQSEQHVYHLYVVLSRQRKALQEHFKKQGVEALIHYPIPIHFQEPCTELRRDPLGLRQAELHAERCLSLPIHPHLPVPSAAWFP